MLNAVIFDLDGVLVDSHDSHTRVWNTLLRSFNRQLEESDAEMLRDGRKTKELMRSLLGDLSEEDLQMYCRRKDLLFQSEIRNVVAVAGVETFLRQLSRAAVPMAVASSGGAARVRRTLEWLGLRAYFQAIVTGDDVTTGKADPEIFYMAAQQLGVNPVDILVFEDSVSAVRTATAAGMKCVGIARGVYARALLRAGAVAAVPDFTSLSYERLGQFFLRKTRDYETCSGAGAVGQPPFAILEDC